MIIELIFGTWFKNNFSYRLSSERNIYRVYKFNFSNYKGESLYKRDSNAFRYDETPIKENSIDVIFTGGSTTNQKFLNYQDTIVGNLDNHFKEKKIVNAGVDGLSIRGHINSFDLWFNKIDKLSPKHQNSFLDTVLRENKSIEEFYANNINDYDLKLSGTGSTLFIEYDKKDDLKKILQKIPKNWRFFFCEGLQYSPLTGV